MQTMYGLCELNTAVVCSVVTIGEVYIFNYITLFSFDKYLISFQILFD